MYISLSLKSSMRMYPPPPALLPWKLERMAYTVLSGSPSPSSSSCTFL